MSSAASTPSPWSTARGLRYGLLFILAMTEYIPTALLSTAMPVLLRRSGASMEQIGILPLLMIPWAVKALWAPLVDKVGARSRLGRYRGWLFLTHPLLLVTLLVGAFFDIPKLMVSHLNLAALALLWLSVVSATADTASHGLAVGLLSPQERGVGNGVQNAGMMAGMLIGGGLMVMFVDGIGWRATLLCTAALVFLPLAGVALYREAPVTQVEAITFGKGMAFFRQKGAIPWTILLFILAGLPSLPTVPFQVMFVDHGMNLTEIGFVLGVLGSLAGAAGGMLGGWWVKVFGRRRAFYQLTLLCIVCLGMAASIIVSPAPGRPLLYAAVALVVFGMSAGSVIQYVMMMDRCRLHLAGTDYTIQYSTTQLSSFLGSAAGSILAGRIGATALFILVPLSMLGALGLSSYLLLDRDFEPTPYEQ